MENHREHHKSVILGDAILPRMNDGYVNQVSVEIERITEETSQDLSRSENGLLVNLLSWMNFSGHTGNVPRTSHNLASTNQEPKRDCW